MRNQKLNIFILIFTFISIVALLTLYICVPKLKLEKRYVELNVFDKYNPISYKASYLGKDITNEVGIGGYVDTEHTGKYKVTYKVRQGMFNVTKYVIYNVVDKEEPKIELDGEEELKVCSIKHFVEPGYKATDNYDGDLTDKVNKIHINDNEIEYIVKDSSNNIAKKYRKLIETDDIAPTIKLNGNQTVYLSLGATYNEAGVDVSFDFVVRDYATIDSIEQVRGRCNRSRELNKRFNLFINTV